MRYSNSSQFQLNSFKFWGVCAFPTNGIPWYQTKIRNSWVDKSKSHQFVKINMRFANYCILTNMQSSCLWPHQSSSVIFSFAFVSIHAACSILLWICHSPLQTPLCSWSPPHHRLWSLHLHFHHHHLRSWSNPYRNGPSESNRRIPLNSVHQ